jgi:chromosome partitioning protein
MEDLLTLSQISDYTGLKRHALNARLKAKLEQKDVYRTQSNHIKLSPLQTKKLLSDEIQVNKGKVIYVGNLKGGVGKTTISYLLSQATSSLGLKTCILDLDVQANLSQLYNCNSSDVPVFYDIIEGSTQISDAIVPINSNLDILPSSLKNSLIEKALTMQSPKHQLNWINNICIDYLRKNYDIIIVDTPPSLSTLNSVFCLALLSNDSIIVPVCAEEFSIMGVRMFLDDINEIRESYKIQSTPHISILMNKFFQTQTTNLEMLVKMSRTYDGIMSHIIFRDNARIREIMNNKINISTLKNGKEIRALIGSLMKELKLLNVKEVSNG